MTTYSDYEQRQLDIASGEEMDRALDRMRRDRARLAAMQQRSREIARDCEELSRMLDEEADFHEGQDKPDPADWTDL